MEAPTVFLCGDVMTGRGIDQILGAPLPPVLYEPVVDSALDYVALAESVNGRIPRGVPPEYPWGDALDALRRRRPDVRIANLETAITRSETPEPKGINYRMSPGNATVLTAAGIDACALANNHVLDWGSAGLLETLSSLDQLAIRHAGAGADDTHAALPAALPLPGGGRILLFAWGHAGSGIPRGWSATSGRPGVNLLPGLDARTVARVGAAVDAARRPGDLVVASIHWGSNWGYAIPSEQRRFARALIREAGVHVVHGHSSHHARGMELVDGHLVLYGCGDFLNDYEGIGGYEAYRGDLALMYFARIAPDDGQLVGLDLVPLRLRRFRLEYAPGEDVDWLAATLQRESAPFGVELRRTGPQALALSPR